MNFATGNDIKFELYNKMIQSDTVSDVMKTMKDMEGLSFFYDDTGFIAFKEREKFGKKWTKIYYLFVYPEYRRTGQWSRFYEAVGEWSKLPVLHVTMDSSIARWICEKLGMRLMTILDNEFGSTDYYWEDTIFWKPTLNKPTLNKQDQGKPRYDLLPWGVLDEVASLLTVGAVKYGDNNWLYNSSKDDIKRYEAALARHFSKHMQGEFTDEETGYSHLAAVICNAMFILALRRKYGN